MALRAAQREVVEHEIFSYLVKEAGYLPTSAARVSERLIVIEAAKGVELRFELIDDDAIPSQPAVVSSAKSSTYLVSSAELPMIAIHTDSPR